MLQARVALRLPWWSLSTGFAAVRQMAGLQGDASAVQKALKEQTYAANGALPPGAMPAKDDRQVRHFNTSTVHEGSVATTHCTCLHLVSESACGVMGNSFAAAHHSALG